MKTTHTPADIAREGPSAEEMLDWCNKNPENCPTFEDGHWVLNHLYDGYDCPHGSFAERKFPNIRDAIKVAMSTGNKATCASDEEKPCVDEPEESGKKPAYMDCPRMKLVSESNGWERYACKLCGKKYKLDQEEMK